MASGVFKFFVAFLITFSLGITTASAKHRDYATFPTLSASGGVKYIFSEEIETYDGFFTFPPNNLPSPIPFLPPGSQSKYPGLNDPPVGTYLYCLLLAGSKYAFTTMGITVLTLLVPESLSKGTPLNLYSVQIPRSKDGATFSPVQWSTPIEGTWLGKSVVIFQIPPYTQAAHTDLIYVLTQ